MSFGAVIDFWVTDKLSSETRRAAGNYSRWLSADSWSRKQEVNSAVFCFPVEISVICVSWLNSAAPLPSSGHFDMWGWKVTTHSSPTTEKTARQELPAVCYWLRKGPWERHLKVACSALHSCPPPSLEEYCPIHCTAIRKTVAIFVSRGCVQHKHSALLATGCCKSLLPPHHSLSPCHPAAFLLHSRPFLFPSWIFWVLWVVSALITP